MNTPLILTVLLDEDAQAFFNEKRKQYFPPERNFLSAHLTLFHHLPDEPLVTDFLETFSSGQKTIQLIITEPASLGKGVAYKIDSQKIIALNKRLQKEWAEVLTPQDQQGLWPHITVQNKVTPTEAKQTFLQLKEEFIPFTAYAKGLVLWKYLNGPWQWYRQFLFAD